MAGKDDSKDRAGFLFHMVFEDSLKPGDHIYAYRLGGVYAHHGIYIGEPGMEVIHFSGNKRSGKPCVRIQSCTYEDFKDGALLAHLVAYDVNPITAFFKRALTVHPYKSRPAKDVVRTAKYFLQHPKEYDDYHFYFNNCETFAIYCKTKKVMPSSQLTPFSSVIDSVVALDDALQDDYEKKKALPSSQFTPFPSVQVLLAFADVLRDDYEKKKAMPSFQFTPFPSVQVLLALDDALRDDYKKKKALPSSQLTPFSSAQVPPAFADVLRDSDD